jgi:hypothetical protein
MTSVRCSERISKMNPVVYFEKKPIGPSKTLLGRLEREMAEFDDAEFRKMVKEVTHVDNKTVALVDLEGRTWVVERSFDFLTKAPYVFRNGKAVMTKYDWYPSLTSSRWLLMLMTQVE